MEEDEDAQQQRLREKAQKRLPQYKYRDMLQKLADRKLDEALIDLDDLATVRPIFTESLSADPNCCLVCRANQRRPEACRVNRK